MIPLITLTSFGGFRPVHGRHHRKRFSQNNALSDSGVAVTSRASMFRLRFVIAILFLAPASLWAQGHGTLRGHVRDANNGSNLQGVEVRVLENGRTAVTARDGSYSIPGLPPGTYAVSFSYLGYESVNRTVTLDTGTASLDVSLGEEAILLAAFEVEGVREGQARALNQQKTAGNIRNIVAADAIGNFPDKNVAESLQRIPGIHTRSFLGEPRFVSIRGASPHQNAITLDGVSILSAEQDIRTVALDTFPSAQVSSIEVVKAVTPELDGDSIGGAVILKGRSAFDAGQRVFSLSASSNYNDLVDSFGYRGAMNFGDTFGAKDDWGIQLSVSREDYKSWEQTNETNNWTPTTVTTGGRTLTGFVPATLLQSSVFVHKRRTAVSGALEKKLGDSTIAFVRAFRNNFNDTHERDGLRYEVGVNATGAGLDLTQPVEVLPDGTFTRYTTTRTTMRRQTQPQEFHSQAEGLIGGIKVDNATWGAEVSAALSRTTNDFWTTQAQWVSKSNANRAIIDQSDADFWRVTQLTGTDYFDASGLRFQQANNRQQSILNKERMIKADAYKFFDVGETQLKLTAGGKSRLGVKGRDNNVAVWNGLVAGETLDMDDPRLGGLVELAPSWLDGRYDFGPSVDTWKYAEFFAENRSTFDPVAVAFTDTKGIFTPNLNNSYNNSLQNDYSVDEDIHAGYVRADWGWGRASFIAGFRYELTDLTLRGTQIDGTKPNSDRSRYQPYQRKSDYDNLLPSFHVRFEVTPEFVLRAAWTNTLARPLVNDMVSSFNVNTVNRTINGGNPNLKATESENWDLSAEYYLSSVGILSVGLFQKDLDGPIYESTVPMEFDAGDGVHTYQFTTSLNAGKAKLRGAEFSYQQQLRFLPTPFDGLGFYGNLTLVESDVEVPARPNEKFTLFDQADTIGNIAVFYQKYGLNARLAYTFRSDYLSVLLLPGTDTYYDDEKRLDFQIGYKFKQHWTVQLEANNLLNTPEQQFHGTRSRQEVYGLNGRFYSIGLTWEL